MADSKSILDIAEPNQTQDPTAKGKHIIGGFVDENSNPHPFRGDSVTGGLIVAAGTFSAPVGIATETNQDEQLLRQGNIGDLPAAGTELGLLSGIYSSVIPVTAIGATNDAPAAYPTSTVDETLISLNKTMVNLLDSIEQKTVTIDLSNTQIEINSDQILLSVDELEERIGALNEAEPANNSVASGLNGRLKALLTRAETANATLALLATEASLLNAITELVAINAELNTITAELVSQTALLTTIDADTSAINTATASIDADIDVPLSTRASEATLLLTNAELVAANAELDAQTALLTTIDQSADDIETAVESLDTKFDVALSTRASEVTQLANNTELIAVNAELDAQTTLLTSIDASANDIETAVESIDADIDVPLSTRATEVTQLANNTELVAINAELDAQTVLLTDIEADTTQIATNTTGLNLLSKDVGASDANTLRVVLENQARDAIGASADAANDPTLMGQAKQANVNLDAIELQQIDGTQVSQVRGAAKGATLAGNVTSTDASADRQLLDVILRDTTGAPIVDKGNRELLFDAGVQTLGVGTFTVLSIDRVDPAYLGKASYLILKFGNTVYTGAGTTIETSNDPTFADANVTDTLPIVRIDVASAPAFNIGNTTGAGGQGGLFTVQLEKALRYVRVRSTIATGTMTVLAQLWRGDLIDTVVNNVPLGNTPVVGAVQHDGVLNTAPVGMGAAAHNTKPSAVSADQDVTRVWATRSGAFVTGGYHDLADTQLTSPVSSDIALTSFRGVHVGIMGTDGFNVQRVNATTTPASVAAGRRSSIEFKPINGNIAVSHSNTVTYATGRPVLAGDSFITTSMNEIFYVAETGTVDLCITQG